jgi:hypothetical protein
MEIDELGLGSLSSPALTNPACFDDGFVGGGGCSVMDRVEVGEGRGNF